MKAESWEIPFSGKPDVMQRKTHGSLNSPRAFGSFGHIARFIVNANHSIMSAARHTTGDRMPAHLLIASGFRFDPFRLFPLPCSS
jgi:hypothetical protein